MRRLLESRIVLGINYPYMEQARANRIICEIKRHRRARWGCFFMSGQFVLWKLKSLWKCEVDCPSRSTGVNLDKKQTCCSLSCSFFYLKLNRMHLAKVIFKLFVIYRQNAYVIDVLINWKFMVFFLYFMQELSFCNLVIFRTFY